MSDLDNSLNKLDDLIDSIGERMTLEEIRNYSIHYCKHQVVDTVD